jgi:hypothetical protein
VGGFNCAITVMQTQTAAYNTLSFGELPGALDSFAPADGDYMAPPAGNDGTEAYWSLSTGAKLVKDYRAMGDDVQWKMVVIVPAEQSWALAWTPGNLPADSYVTLTALDMDGKATGSTLDMKTVSTVALDNSAGTGLKTYQYQVRVAQTYQVTCNLEVGWNMIGMPLVLDSASQTALVGHAHVPAVYSWGPDNGYELVSELVPGKGYWVYADVELSLTLTGRPVTETAVTLSAGWNLVAPMADAIDPVAACTDYSLLSIWGWKPSQGYAIPSAADGKPCKAGYGYWIYSTEEGLTIWNTSAR